MNYYEELGISPDASPEEIRAAFRKKAKAHHPDREGGDSVAMAAVNHARDTLIDPVKRLTYDRTGKDKPAPPIDKVAQDMLMTNIQSWIASDNTSGNLTADLSRHFDLERNKALQQIAAVTASLAKTEKRMAKLKYRGTGQDFVRAAMEHTIFGMRQQIERSRDTAALIERAKAMLSVYEYEVDPPPPVFNFLSGHTVRLT